MSTMLTDRKVQSLKPSPGGKPYDVKDTQVPGLRVRVMGSGLRTFVLLGRFPGSANPTRRALGSYGELTLEQAREKATDWRKSVKRGVDPQIEEARLRAAALVQQQCTFGVVAEDFITKKLPTERKGKEVEADIRREFLPLWKDRPIADIPRREIRDVIEAKMQTAPAQARNLLGTIKRLFSWAVDQERYGLSASPADTLKPTKIIGEKVSGSRILDDAELFALWRAAKRIPYPHGPVYQLPILTALRLNEAADAAKPEFDTNKKVWIIPAVRMKGRQSKARPHAVPLTDQVLAVLESLPRFKAGNFLFSTTFGTSSVWMSDKVKKRVDERMLLTLRALARRRGGDPAKVNLAPWTNHDIRRTVRSNLSALRIAEEVREAVLAHARPGIKGVYDLHDYLDEKREALDLWAARLRSIVDPPPPNVISIESARGRPS